MELLLKLTKKLDSLESEISKCANKRDLTVISTHIEEKIDKLHTKFNEANTLLKNKLIDISKHRADDSAEIGAQLNLIQNGRTP